MALEKEEAAGQIFGRRQWWRAGPVAFLVSFDRDGQRRGIFVSGTSETPSAEALFDSLGLEREDDITLEPSIDCYAIGCPTDRLGVMLGRLAVAANR